VIRLSIATVERHRLAVTHEDRATRVVRVVRVVRIKLLGDIGIELHGRPFTVGADASMYRVHLACRSVLANSCGSTSLSAIETTRRLNSRASSADTLGDGVS
jgi:hypothetical protein